MTRKNLLVELFVEELPPKALKKLGDAFAQLLSESLKVQGLVDEITLTSFASPRRLALHVMRVAEVSADKTSKLKLMPVSIGIDGQGNATPALIKRLNGMGLDTTAVSKLTREMDGKAEGLFLEVMQAGVTLKNGLQIALNEAISKLPIPKVMTYQLADGWESVNFVRPAHGLVALHGSEIVPVTALGLTAGNSTLGHRFEANISPVVISHADRYAEQLKTEGAVIASFSERKAEIERQLSAAASQQNLKPIEDDALLDEVTALVERPNILLGQFETIYLEVPPECLILTMKANQKYFPLLDTNDKLTNKFLIVSNISPADPSAVIQGNERVVRPRLADAKFFFDQDRKKTLESRLPELDKMIYHNLLGNQGERTERVCNIARNISLELMNKETYFDESIADQASMAAKLSKTDLLTDMVGEFPELQGIMGAYYAIHDGLPTDIAIAIEDHYKPRFAGDKLPRNQIGTIVALSDKIETLVGLFGINQIPTGDKDPFGLRRHALGILRLLDEKQLQVDLITLINIASNQFKALANFKRNDNLILDFIYERAVSLFLENGFSRSEIEAVLVIDPIHIYNVKKRLGAVRAFLELSEAPALNAANKRVSNILKKVEFEVKAEVSAILLKEPAEIALNEALSQIKPEADKLFENHDYTSSLKALAVLKAPVDAFFDSVMVNTDEPALKANRLGLLATLHQTMNRVADLSKLAN